MNLINNINRHLFTQVNVDSGSLSILSAVIHRFAQPGEYEGIVMKGPIKTQRFTVTVVEDNNIISSSSQAAAATNTNAAAAEQIKVDLKDTASDRFTLRRGGYGVFYVSTGPGGYVVEIRKYEKGSQVKVFDSSELKEDDIFSTTIIRPGTYSVTNTLNNAKAELMVNYPEIGKTQRNPQPIKIECTAQNQINPNRIRIDPSQGLVFTSKTPFRIKIELTKPEDRPSRLARKEGTLAQRIAQQKGQEKKIIRRYRLMPSGGS
ncbi:hypothetical protein NTE_00557 [Candidatus Nitrososphaera evergladensis SR1]|uniref:Uncharacterized protein n=1 Tax=Candidatus Nitrososphaera evergladensis SR1 TaxID=1459636 RepID=A0A075MMZ8_9ARCH|nr:hypothetical protein [Candidatus Nitrososphaera evergladensis]AIF82638.1 hypothetical protein NTE_00557 [Candidatus Nitrososphaera evergladensis SR1]